MSLPLPVPNVDAPDGETYGVALVSGGPAAHDPLFDVLGDVRFSGWVGTDEGWIWVLGDPGGGVVASARQGIVEIAALLAHRLGTEVIVARVKTDRQLVLGAWRGADELGRYSSDPSREPGADEEVLTDPVGSEIAEELAVICDRADAADDLRELLDEELDAESVFESERLAHVLRLLGLPGWIVASAALPRDIPTGPRATAFTRLHAGRRGIVGRISRLAVDVARRRRTPPPAIADPPRAGAIDPWLL